MKKQTIDSLGVTLSRLGFGAMRLPRLGDEIDQKQTDEMVRYAFENGVNYFDTAYVYGDGASEIAMGKALARLPRDRFYVADKMPFWGAQDVSWLDEKFQTTLDRLQMDHVDFYLMHSMDRSTFAAMKKFGAYEWALKKKAEGKIRFLGFSIHDDAALLQEILEVGAWDFAQIQLNYLDLDDNPGEKGYHMLREHNIPVMIMEPLKGGVLSDIPDHLAEPFLRLGGSKVEYAFRWLAEHPGIAVILLGMSNMEQLRQNVKVFAGLEPLSAAEHEAILQVKKNILDAQKVGCTGCRYCLPCPMGVMIPDLFKAWNNKAMQQNSNWISSADIDYEMAEKCVACGQCMTHCPQHIEIPAMLRRMIAEKK